MAKVTKATIKAFVLGPLDTNSYVISIGNSCSIVDAGMQPGPLLEYLAESKLAPDRLLLTHAHGDHIAGIPQIKASFPAVKVVCPRADAEMLTDAALNMSGMLGVPLTVGEADRLIDPGGTIDVGATRWQVLNTSGHTPGGMSYYCRDQQAVFTGDALFAGSIGRTDIPGGDEPKLLQNIRESLLSLPDGTVVLPGHGPASTIARERRENPFLGAWA